MPLGMAVPLGLCAFYVRTRARRLTVVTADQPGKPFPGCCHFYIKRKRRYCRMRPTDDSGNFCSRHEPVALKAAQDYSYNFTGADNPSKKKAVESDDLTCAGRISSSQKRMVNPLGKKYQNLLSSDQLDWSKAFENPHLPLHIDVGCARGKMMCELSEKEPDFNYLGLEIRPQLTEAANEYRDANNLRNLHFIACNFNVVHRQLLESLQNVLPGRLQRISFLFPDPWARTSHRKRRIVQREVAESLAQHMKQGAGSGLARYGQNVFEWCDGGDSSSCLHCFPSEVVLVCDYEELAEEMCSFFDEHADVFERKAEASTSSEEPASEKSKWLRTHPLSVKSERELVCEIKWRPVYRALYTVR